jgi:hypothetical protein
LRRGRGGGVLPRSLWSSWPCRFLHSSPGAAPFDVVDTKGHVGDRILFSKWNSFSRVGGLRPSARRMVTEPEVHRRAATLAVHGYRLGCVDAHLKGTGSIADASYLRYELTALAITWLSARPGSTSLVIGPGGGGSAVRARLRRVALWTGSRSIRSSRAT